MNPSPQEKTPPDPAPPSAPSQAGQSTENYRSLADSVPDPEATMDRLQQPAGPLVAKKPALPSIPGYDVLEILGRGGMGVVYKARQVRLKRLVALKMIRGGDLAGAEELDRFRAEAEAVARLQHPNIVQIHEVGEHEGHPFFSLEFVDGGNLGQRLAGSPLPPREAAQLLETLARAVDYAHEHGIVHRDLKPANILLQMADSRQQEKLGERSTLKQGTEKTPRAQSASPNLQAAIPKVTDFGLAKQLDLDAGQTRTGQIMGTPSYMAPEQASGDVKAIGPACDTYALGAILYEMLTGRPPFRAASVMETLDQVRTQEPVPPRQLQPRLPVELDTICLKCLHKEPAKRYVRALDLAEDLRRFLHNEPIKARPAGAIERLVKWVKRKPTAAALWRGRVLLFSPDGRFLVSPNGLQGVALWNTSTGLEERIFPNGDRQVHAFGFSPDGQRLAAAFNDRTIKVWDVNSAQLLQTLIGHAIDPKLESLEQITALAFHPDNQRLASAGRDGTVRIWDLNPSHGATEIQPQSDLAQSAHFLPDGETLVTTGKYHDPVLKRELGLIRLLELPTRKSRFVVPHHYFRVGI